MMSYDGILGLARAGLTCRLTSLLWLFFHQTTTNSNHTNTELPDETSRLVVNSFSSILQFTIYNPFSPTCHHDPQPADGFH